ncbi:transcriptional regulator, LacI family [Coriobacterium glomerans PW2]|uniref:Transcriptional regulator, LacI family n=1 Tax=Coriobacterium glomerans (strain ATCC 49209 / DSM 20642 / JCM 10262 / PW2) TaxID=700015 RepID=F2N942_CORGP|nr:LacI family DNA-binding transcriptional regulator [Coriobacterium glomerans]AEB07718.1 transcriptional regulator, LacI family [Coriobacterium glomerans PW2]
MPKASVREISRVTGFSPATVSNALNHKRNVSEQTARVIIDAARTMGYQQNSQLETIQFVLARKTGEIVDESTFHPAVIEGVERQARRHNMGTSFVTLDFSDSETVRHDVDALIADSQAAVILLGTELSDEDFDLFRDSAAHLIVLDGWSDRHYFDTVAIANADSALRAVRHLIDRGHRSIGYLAGRFRIQNFRARERGYLQALSDAGIAFDPSWRIMLGTTLESAYEDMADWLAAISPERLPSALFADNDVLAVGALRALREHGLRVPGDISIIGFDDLSFGAFSDPPLTTMHVLKQEVGEIAVRRLVGNIRNPKSYTCKTQVSTYLVERESVSECLRDPR